MLNLITRLLPRGAREARRRQTLGETIHVSRVLRERGATSAVRRALLNARARDGSQMMREGSHAWPVTRDRLQLLARELEEQRRADGPVSGEAVAFRIES